MKKLFYLLAISLWAMARAGAQAPSPQPDDVTPDIQALADGLQHDPLKIYNYCLNQIRYEHYWGSKKGATVTLLEGGGNDCDTATLMVALLHASNITTVNYHISALNLTDTAMQEWFGSSPSGSSDPADLPFGDLSDTQFLWEHPNQDTGNISTLNWRYIADRGVLNGLEGIPYSEYLNYGANWKIPHIWVQLTIGGTTYELDPSHKQYATAATKIDLAAATQYTHSGQGAFLSYDGGTVGANYVQSINEGNLSLQLQGYSGNLAAWLKANRPNDSIDQLLGKRQMIKNYATSLANVSLTSGDYDDSRWPGLTQIVPQVPAKWQATIEITLGQFDEGSGEFDSVGFDQTIPLSTLNGQKLALHFSGNTAIITLDEATWGSFNLTNSTVDMEIYVNQPYGSLDPTTGDFTDGDWLDDDTITTYTKNDAYASVIGVCFNPGSWLTRKRQAILDQYIQSGLTDSDWRVKTELLYLLTLTYKEECNLSDGLVGSLYGGSPIGSSIIGRATQETSFFIDEFAPSVEYVPANLRTDTQNAFYLVSNTFDAGYEHGVIEQILGSGTQAISTIKALEVANQQGGKVYLATPANWASTVEPSLGNYSSSTLSDVSSNISDGIDVLLPANGNLVVGTWNGSGYAYSDGFSFGFIITGGIGGGRAVNVDDITSAPILSSILSDPGYETTPPLTIQNYVPITQPAVGADPVNMQSGAFMHEKTDLALGSSEPCGLSFTREYGSDRSLDNSEGLGYGWTYNYNMNVTPRSDAVAGLGGVTAAEASPYLAAVTVVSDLLAGNITGNLTQVDLGNITAQKWETACIAIKWALDQITYNCISVTLGNRILEFAQMPDGSYIGPPGSTLTLQKVSGNYTLSERNGNTYAFGANNKIGNITNPYGKTLSFAYNVTTGNLSTVTDCYGRNLTLTWTGGNITQVADSTGRSVNFSYTAGDLTSATDADGNTWAYVYSNHQITDLLNPSSVTIAHNDYDNQGRVYQQKTNGDPARTWKLYFTGAENSQLDPRGDLTTYFYDDRGRLTSTQDALGDADASSYDGQDHVILHTSPEGENTTLTYDGNNDLMETMDPSGNFTSNGYDSLFQLSNITDFKGNVSANYTYNAEHQVLTVTDAKNVMVANYTYDAGGNLSTFKDAAGNTTTYTPDTYGNVQRIDYPDTTYETFSYDAIGNLLSHTDARGNTTSYTYNNRRQVLTVTPPGGGGNITNTYDNAGNLQSTQDQRGNTTSYTYSATRKLLTTTLPATDAGSLVITNSYDTRDWLTSTTDSLGRATTYTYDAAGRVTGTMDSLNRPTTSGYNADGQATSQADALGASTTFGYDARGLQNTVEDATSHTLTTVFDPNRNRQSLTNRRSKTYNFTYDANNRLLTSATPLSNTATNAWNNLGLLQSVVDAASNTTTLTYDKLGRTKSVTDPVGSVTYTYDGNGNPTGITDGTATLTRVFDARNRVTSYTDAAGNTIGYTYDSNGNLLTLTYPGSKVVTYTYDALNHLKTVTDWNSAVTTYTYDAGGRLTQITRPNGTTRALFYDTGDQVLRIEERLGNGTLLAGYQFDYDADGRVVSQLSGPVAAQAYTVTPGNATYDDDNRLATFNGNTVTCDNNGNMLSGPLLSNTTVTYTYDARNRLVSAGNVTYLYDMVGTRTGYMVGGCTTTFVVDPNAALSRTLMRTTPGNVTTYYVYGGSGLLYETTSGGSITTYHYDQIGSTSYLVDNSGNTTTDHFEYTPYGSISYRTGSTDTPFQYNGAFGVMTDPNNGLLNMRARFYDPFIRRFVNADPIGFQGGLNWFAYAGGNPISNTDPFGLFLGTNLDASEFFAAAGSGAAHGAAVYGEGLAVGAASAVVVTGVAVSAAAIGVPTAVVTGTLFAAGAVGFGSTAYNLYEDPTIDNITYNVGAFTGAAAVGGAAARFVSSILSPPEYQPPAQGWPSLTQNSWRTNGGKGPISPTQFMKDWINPASTARPMGTGPDMWGAAGTITTAGAGVASGLK